jgi:hypothetical protein
VWARRGSHGCEQEPEQVEHTLSIADLRSPEVLPPHTLEHILPALPEQYGNVIVWALVLLLTYAFAAFVFRIVERLQAQALARSSGQSSTNARG